MCGFCRELGKDIVAIEEAVATYQSDLELRVQADIDGGGFDCCECSEAVLLRRVRDALEHIGIWKKGE